MAVCPACGSEVAEGSNFCTSCGRPMSSAAASPAPPANGMFCPACNAAVESSSLFCTGCGKKLPSTVATGNTPAPSEPTVIPAASASDAPASADPVATAAVAPAPASPPAESAPYVPPPAPPPAPPDQPAAQPEPQVYPAPAAYPPTQQPGSSGFGLVVVILLIVIFAAGFGGWYFWGVETIVVCSPPDVRAFLDDQELSPASYGRYVIPHLSRKPHLLRVQRQGFADTVERLDFPLTSSREWVNIRLVLSRQPRR